MAKLLIRAGGRERLHFERVYRLNANSVTVSGTHELKDHLNVGHNTSILISWGL